MLRRFLGYLDKIFDFRTPLSRLTDTRVGAQVSTAGVWLSVFWMFVLRLKSFNAVEQELRRPGRWEKLIGRRKPSADTLGYALKKFSVESVRGLLRDHLRRAWRNKAVQGRPGQRHRVVAIDGHELWASRARCCPDCLVRDIEVKGRPVREYYHRVVAAQWIGVTPAGLIDFEMVRPGEGEVVAAGRLTDRLLRDYDRLIDVISADAIYLEAPFLRRIRKARKHFIVVMKQEARCLYQDADQLRRVQSPTVVQVGCTTSRIWDLPGLTTFETLGEPVRVVWVEESTVRTRFVGGKKQSVQEDKTWIWVTDLPATVVSAAWIQRWGHDRWDLENRGFNELAALWQMDHCFVHDSTAIQVLLLTLALAFLTTYLFFERNLKPQRRSCMTRSTLPARFAEDLGSIRLQPSG